MITSRQIRAARQLLGWHQPRLAREAGLSLNTIKDIERETANPLAATLEAIEAALRRAGLELLEPGQSSTGVGRGLRFQNADAE
jgi:transcriptional regulator with XRE-family HTH domain